VGLIGVKDGIFINKQIDIFSYSTIFPTTNEVQVIVVCLGETKYFHSSYPPWHRLLEYPLRLTVLLSKLDLVGLTEAAITLQI
jgi:hypothetical protein